MISSPKALGHVIVAVFVASAMFVSAAHAEEKTPTFTATKTPVRETGSQLEAHEITVNAGVIECAKANLIDSAGNGGMMLIMEPSYSGCTFAGLAATVKMNGCTYTFEPIKTIEADRYTGRMGILCPTGKAIEISTTGCLVTIGEQFNLETVEFTNNTNAEQAKDDETWRTAIKNAEYMQTGTLCKGGVFANMTYSGSTTVKGESAETGEQIGLWIGD
jgi:hypothetical protein